jgi:hypothetical protein
VIIIVVVVIIAVAVVVVVLTAIVASQHGVLLNVTLSPALPDPSSP